MILKIVRREFKAGDKEEYDCYWATIFKGCWIIGEIEMIHHDRIPKKDVEGRYYTESDCREFYDLKIRHLTNEKMLSSGALQLQLTFSDRSKNDFNALLQDCTCFICNEDGKTIDKLTC